MHWLVERWCEVIWGAQAKLRTPLKREPLLGCLQGMPYLTATKSSRSLQTCRKPQFQVAAEAAAQEKWAQRS